MTDDQRALSLKPVSLKPVSSKPVSLKPVSLKPVSLKPSRAPNSELQALHAQRPLLRQSYDYAGWKEKKKERKREREMTPPNKMYCSRHNEQEKKKSCR